MGEKTEEQEERDWKLVEVQLDLLYELFPDEVKQWIYEQWPHGIGLYN